MLHINVNDLLFIVFIYFYNMQRRGTLYEAETILASLEHNLQEKGIELLKCGTDLGPYMKDKNGDEFYTVGLKMVVRKSVYIISKLLKEEDKNWNCGWAIHSEVESKSKKLYSMTTHKHTIEMSISQVVESILKNDPEICNTVDRPCQM